MIVGLIGAPAAGKDDVVGYILRFQYGFSWFSFAERIKNGYYLETGITEEQFKSCRGTPKEEEIRKGLWEFSDRVKRDGGKYIFINSLIKEVPNHEDAVITDIRTEEELEKTLEIGGKILVVVRDKDILEGDGLFPESRLSKVRVREFECYVNNYDTLEEARNAFRELYERGEILMDEA